MKQEGRKGISTASTPRITCRRKRAKPAVAGQVHADVGRHCDYHLSIFFTFVVFAHGSSRISLLQAAAASRAARRLASAVAFRDSLEFQSSVGGLKWEHELGILDPETVTSCRSRPDQYIGHGNSATTA